jgi:hypothetical protein
MRKRLEEFLLALKKPFQNLSKSKSDIYILIFFSMLSIITEPKEEMGLFEENVQIQIGCYS